MEKNEELSIVLTMFRTHLDATANTHFNRGAQEIIDFLDLHKDELGDKYVEFKEAVREYFRDCTEARSNGWTEIFEKVFPGVNVFRHNKASQM